MRVLIDSYILRKRPAGTARWVRGLIAALGERPDASVVPEPGPPRLGNGWLFRVPNLLAERWWYERGVMRAARRVKADVLLMPANLSARRGRLPQVVTILDVNFLSQPGTYEPAFVRYATWAFRRAARDADVITTLSDYSRGEIIEYLDADPAKIRVVYPGLSRKRCEAAAPPMRGPYALYVGATEVHKNVRILLDAWRGNEAPGGLSLAIVGQPGRDHAAVEQIASSLGGRVTVRGPVSESELEGWYSNATVFLFPSRTEGFGFPPLEAMERGVPVIAARAGALPEVLGDSALFHDPRDAESLRSLVTRLAEDSELRADLVARGRQRSSMYTWASTAESMVGVLTETVGSHGTDRKA